ncbi:Quinol monooxygenase YgiN [Parafrankia irregularis]|uniref:Quinol monooxygenase YgiN n=1 Tax=Parafrankia irregularis TaxID=795642 RepID=A0A0S4QNM5_9ACTN|nr:MULTISPECIES: antibiotic biosynthesis monooxygenase [Parafrankia]MBE3200584.1 antibiotic biosynthesis monooxygenase [Parafrankia sp. CH37]CUU56916.1 Quinol monooxygenase YgiN [Parafrankia irregularis]
MFIAIVDFSTSVDDRPAALAELDHERDEVRAMPGNLSFRVHASREDENQITIVHEWDGPESFAAYLESASFARMGNALRPMMTAAPVSRRFDARLLETVA